MSSSVWLVGWLFVCLFVGLLVCLFACLLACLLVCIYVCMYVGFFSDKLFRSLILSFSFSSFRSSLRLIAADQEAIDLVILDLGSVSRVTCRCEYKLGFPCFDNL